MHAYVCMHLLYQYTHTHTQHTRTHTHTHKTRTKFLACHYRALLSQNRALLSDHRARLPEYRALQSEYRAFCQYSAFQCQKRALWSDNRAHRCRREWSSVRGYCLQFVVTVFSSWLLSESVAGDSYLLWLYMCIYMSVSVTEDSNHSQESLVTVSL